MTLFGTDLLTELRRPLRTNGPLSRSGIAAIALVTLAALVVIAGLGVLPGTPLGPESWLLAPLGSGFSSSIDVYRTPVLLGLAQMGAVGLFAGMLALVPLSFAMVRRAHSTGLPRFLAIALVLLTVVSTLSVICTAEQRIVFPLTRGLWAASTADLASMEEKLGVALLLFPILFFTIVFDLLLVAFVGLLAMVVALATWIGCIIVSLIRTREDLFP